MQQCQHRKSSNLVSPSRSDSPCSKSNGTRVKFATPRQKLLPTETSNTYTDNNTCNERLGKESGRSEPLMRRGLSLHPTRDVSGRMGLCTVSLRTTVAPMQFHDGNSNSCCGDD
eukprot:6115649-Amphidinium_carterae.1